MNASGLNASALASPPPPPPHANATVATYLPYGLIIDLINGINAFTMLPSLCFLAWILAAILGTRLRHNYRHVLFANLLLCDSLFLISSDTVAILVWQRVPIPAVPCYAFALVASALKYAGLLCVTLMSLERYAAVCHPLRYHAWFDRPVALVASLAAVWSGCAWSPLARVLLLVSDGVPLPANEAVCAVERIEGLMPNATALLVLREATNAAAFVASSVAVAFSYVKVFGAARRVAAATATATATATGSGGASKARNTVALHSLQLVLYICSLANSAVLAVVGAAIGDPRASSVARSATYVALFVLSRLVAPVVYGLRDKEILGQMKRMLGVVRPVEVAPAEVA
ncbi:odorant receptor 131-2-like [Lethenteron reissneri]|uniref:odorant receptor 131-2-like n=1 Tax=Lethenteron reissneri TaxID=7753 RepID=UPI002AB7AC7A|nr:odorant receptor 131-2-like [Lethenteron reissneri]